MPSAAELKGKYVAFKLDPGGASADQDRLAHVGTAHEPTDPATIAVKNAWKALAARVTSIVARRRSRTSSRRSTAGALVERRQPETVRLNG